MSKNVALKPREARKVIESALVAELAKRALSDHEKRPRAAPRDMATISAMVDSAGEIKFWYSFRLYGRNHSAFRGEPTEQAAIEEMQRQVRRLHATHLCHPVPTFDESFWRHPSMEHLTAPQCPGCGSKTKALPGAASEYCPACWWWPYEVHSEYRLQYMEIWWRGGYAAAFRGEPCGLHHHLDTTQASERKLCAWFRGYHDGPQPEREFPRKSSEYRISPERCPETDKERGDAHLDALRRDPRMSPTKQGTTMPPKRRPTR